MTCKGCEKLREALRQIDYVASKHFTTDPLILVIREEARLHTRCQFDCSDMTQREDWDSSMPPCSCEGACLICHTSDVSVVASDNEIYGVERSCKTCESIGGPRTRCRECWPRTHHLLHPFPNWKASRDIVAAYRAGKR